MWNLLRYRDQPDGNQSISLITEKAQLEVIWGKVEKGTEGTWTVISKTYLLEIRSGNVFPVRLAYEDEIWLFNIAMRIFCYFSR